MSSGKRTKRELSDHEADAVKAKLRDLVKTLGNMREVGKALNFPEISASQAVEKALRVRPGREMAEKLYTYLETTREVFLGGPEITLKAALKEENWERAGLSPEAARRFVAMLEAETSKGKPDDPSPPPLRLPPATTAPKKPHRD